MNDVDEVKSRLDIVEVIGGYVQLKQMGRSFKGLSPFKTEKTPSFIVSPEKNIWHDFSSNRGGDVIGFVMEVEGVSFPEALEMLAKRAGVALKPRKFGNNKETSIKNRLFEANDSAMAYFHMALSKDADSKSYFINQRGLSRDTIKHFKLGFSPDTWDSLTVHLRSKGFSDDELVAAGLCAKSPKSSSVYDLFRGRVMFPVFDAQGRTIGFSARTLSSQKIAKYINTPQTAVYNKSLAIYGLTQAKEAIRQADGVVVVEGNMDVLALANAGYKNVVACSGTALTDMQVRQLSRLSKNIKLCFDADEAGVNATLRAIELASKQEVRIDIIGLNDAKDPDEMLKKDKTSWQRALDSAMYAPDYLISLGKTKYSTLTAPGKKQFISFILPMIRSFTDDIETQHYIKTVAQIVDVAEEHIFKLLNSSITKTTAPAIISSTLDLPGADSDNGPIEDKRKLTRPEKLEQELLELCLAFPIAAPALDDLEVDQITDLHQSIFEGIKNNTDAKFDSIVKGLPEQENYVKILALRGEQQYADFSAHDIRLEAFTQVARVQETNRQSVKQKLARQLYEAESSGDIKLSKELLRQYQALINEDK